MFVRYSPPESALYRSLYPPDADSQWDLHAQLAADVADTNRLLLWAKTKDGAKNRNRPKPIPRPGVQSDEKRRGGKTSVPLDQAASRYKVSRLAPSGTVTQLRAQAKARGLRGYSRMRRGELIAALTT